MARAKVYDSSALFATPALRSCVANALATPWHARGGHGQESWQQFLSSSQHLDPHSLWEECPSACATVQQIKRVKDSSLANFNSNTSASRCGFFVKLVENIIDHAHQIPTTAPWVGLPGFEPGAS